MGLRTTVPFLAFGLVAACARADLVDSGAARDTAADSVFDVATARYSAAALALGPTVYPDITQASGWHATDASAWTSGFYPGIFWYLQAHTGDDAWKQRALAAEEAIAPRAVDGTTSNLGFMFQTSFGHDPGADARRTLLRAAATLAGRFDDTVGCIRSKDIGDPSVFVVQIDTLMNVELLFWGADQPDGDPAWRSMATRHALRALADHVRPDGTTFHIVVYDAATGAVSTKTTAQGYAPDSTWTRGQTWAMHGFTAAFRETHDARFLAAAREVTDAYLARLAPGDFVPPWDFDAPLDGLLGDKDSSAAAVSASALLNLAAVEDDARRSGAYADAARKVLAQLSGPDYLASPAAGPALLAHGTMDRPHGSADTGTIWGDYYFLEALVKSERR